MSYVLTLLTERTTFLIEGSPDRWWVTSRSRNSATLNLAIEGSPDRWWVTSLIHKVNNQDLLNWRVTRSLVSYVLIFNRLGCCIKLKGHQIVGELRHKTLLNTLELKRLKGHQIVGELRLICFSLITVIINWRVTRSLVSYVISIKSGSCYNHIEGSPDRWWVTSKSA